MRQVVVLISIIIFSAFNTVAQEEEILLKIGDTEISKAEFERIYKKNNQNLFDESDRKTPEEYLDLFIDYKLKVIEAQNLKMDTSQVFKEELAGYRKELAAPYLTDIKYNEKMVHELHDRMKKEVNASHILLRIPQNATNEEAGKILEKAQKIRKEILAGKDFGQAAQEYSEDPSAETNKGNLGYFTAFQMVAPFENAVFSLEEGEVSEPIRTSFGYHIIKVHDYRKNRGELKVAHIMKMFPQNVKSFNKNKLKAEIDSIYNLLENGADFEKLAEINSDDKRSATQGGEMPWFAAGRMIPEFAEAAFAIEKKGGYTEPIETRYGYHIIKKLDERPVPAFEDAKADIEDKIKKDPSRSVNSKKAFIKKLKEEYNFNENSENIAQLKDTKVGDEISGKNKTLFQLDGKNFTVADFETYVKQAGIKGGNLMLNYDSWVENEITEFEDNRLEKKYPEFDFLIKEYHDGILLFNIMEEKIWNFAAKDSSGLQKFYENHKNKYMWEERFKGSIITVENDSVRQEAEKYFTADMPLTEITDLLNKEKQLIEIKEGAWEKGSNPVVDYYVWDAPEPKDLNTELTFIRGDLIPPEPKTLDDARGSYISDYQTFLEKKWLKKLRKKYKIKVNKKLLKSIPDA
ncbi:MAG TPA: peptidylprolyl isomerase [Prolixibacteraceae bacterium]|nr:peptidylprolyl isomerase [Prolixibacteraceae bacterium]